MLCISVCFSEEINVLYIYRVVGGILEEETFPKVCSQEVIKERVIVDQ